MRVKIGIVELTICKVCNTGFALNTKRECMKSSSTHTANKCPHGCTDTGCEYDNTYGKMKCKACNEAKGYKVKTGAPMLWCVK